MLTSLFSYDSVRFESFQSPMGVCRELFRFVFGDRDKHEGQQAAVDSNSVIEKVNPVPLLILLVQFLGQLLFCVFPCTRSCAAGTSGLRRGARG